MSVCSDSYLLSDNSEDDFMVDDESDFDDEPIIAVKPKPSKSTASTAASKAKAQAKAPSKISQSTKATKKKTVDSDNDEEEEEEENVRPNATSVPSVLAERSLNSPNKITKKKTIEDTYKKMSQLEHILIRPDTYSK